MQKHQMLGFTNTITGAVVAPSAETPGAAICVVTRNPLELL